MPLQPSGMHSLQVEANCTGTTVAFILGLVGGSNGQRPGILLITMGER